MQKTWFQTINTSSKKYYIVERIKETTHYNQRYGHGVLIINAASAGEIKLTCFKKQSQPLDFI